jgi:hypothetical protein
MVSGKVAGFIARSPYFTSHIAAADLEAESVSTLSEVLSRAGPAAKGKSIQYPMEGGIQQMEKDFANLSKLGKAIERGDVTTVRLPHGPTITYHPLRDDGPTLYINSSGQKTIKLRY